MKNNYNIKQNPPKLSSEDIGKHKDFDALLNKFNAVRELPDTGEDLLPESAANSNIAVKYLLGGALALVASIALIFMIRSLWTEESLPEGVVDQHALPFPEADPPFTEFEVESEKGATLSLPDALSLEVPAQAFEQADGSPVTGTVTLRYRNLQPPLQQFLAGLPADPALQGAELFQLEALQDGKEVNLKAENPLKLLFPTHSNTEQLEAYQLHEQEWKKQSWQSGLTRVENNINTDFNREAFILAFRKTTPKPSKPIKPSTISADMQPFDVDIKKEEFPELMAYSKIIWVAPKNKLKEEWFVIEWEEVSIEHKSNIEYEFVFRAAHQEIRVEAFPQVAYSKQAMKEYDLAMLQYNKKLNNYNSKLEAALKDAGGNAEAMDALMLKATGTWKLAEEKVMDTPSQSPSFEDLTGAALSLGKIHIYDKNKAVYYASSKAAFPFEEGANIWAMDNQRQLWMATKWNAKKKVLTFKAAELEDLKALLLAGVQ